MSTRRSSVILLTQDAPGCTRAVVRSYLCPWPPARSALHSALSCCSTAPRVLQFLRTSVILYEQLTAAWCRQHVHSAHTSL